MSHIAEIYVVTNKINNKQYVGQTVQDLNRRWNHHVWTAKNQPEKSWKLYNAIRKYGQENFSVETLEKTSTDELNEKEIYWINKLGTFEFGYNLTLGGSGNYKIDRQAVIDLYSKLQNQSQVSRQLNIDLGWVKQILDSEGVEIKSSRDISIKTVYQYKLTGEFIQGFNSVREAAEWIILSGLTSGSIASVSSDISKACRKEASSAYQHTWSYNKMEDNLFVDGRTQVKGRALLTHAVLNGEISHTFSSRIEAARSIQAQGLSNAQEGSIGARIKRAVISGNELFGFQWREDESI